MLEQLVFVTSRSQNEFCRILCTVGCCVLTGQASCFVYFLGLQTEVAETSFTLASVMGHLPVLFCLKMQRVPLNTFTLCGWTFSLVVPYQTLYRISIAL
jgi:hypothetical protein